MNSDSQTLDAQDLLAPLREAFLLPAGKIYLDGNSLGPLPKAVKQRVMAVTEEQWGQDLISSWNQHDWIGLPTAIGDRIGQLIGAASGQTVCADSISVNLYKALCMGLTLNNPKHKVLTTDDNFPTDIYMVQGVEDLLGNHRCELVTCKEDDLLSAIDTDTALVMVTQVNFRTGKIVPVEALVKRAHECGAVVIVDLAHSAGVLPVHLDSWGVDFAVGCTYKYLNAGPGAPGFIYANRKHHHNMVQPLYGWMGHATPFAFSPDYTPAKNATQLLVGTPPVISMSAVDAALDIYDQTTISQIREKSQALSSYFLSCMQQYDSCQVLACISPQQASERGSQLSFAFEHGYSLCQALIAKGVIADFRAPNYIRFGFAPLYNSFNDIAQAVAILDDILTTQAYLAPQFQVRNKVT